MSAALELDAEANLHYDSEESRGWRLRLDLHATLSASTRRHRQPNDESVIVLNAEESEALAKYLASAPTPGPPLAALMQAVAAGTLEELRPDVEWRDREP